MWDALTNRQLGYRNFTPQLHTALRETRVVIVGAGGNGSVLDVLVRAGFERFTIIDPDVVEATNLNRLPFTIAAIGKPKVLAWQDYLLNINPLCRIHAHQQGITLRDALWVTWMLEDGGAKQRADLVFLGTTDPAANLVVGRMCANMGIRMIIGPASSGAWVVSTFTHEAGVNMETVADLGTRDVPLEQVDIAALRQRYMLALNYPGRAKKLTPGVGEAMLKGELAARSCGMFVRMTNAAMAFEAMKNVAVLHNLPLEDTAVVAMPIVQVFDPYSGCAYLCNIQTREIGIADWLHQTTTWYPYP